MGGWLAIIVVALFLLGLAFQGIGRLWIYASPGLAEFWANGKPYVFLFLGVVGVGAFVIFYMDRQYAPPVSATDIAKDIKAVDATRVVAQARQVETDLRETRKVLEREIDSLERLQFTLQDEIHFKLFTQRHNESRLIADRWHEHKREAIEARESISTALNELRGKERRFTKLRDGASAKQRSDISIEIQTTKVAINRLCEINGSLGQEISKGRRFLDVYNKRTRDLKLHIRDHCGPKGRLWYERLEERTRRRNS